MLGTIYGTGFVIAFLLFFWCETRLQRCCWKHDLRMAAIITIFAAVWFLSLPLYVYSAVQVMRERED